MRKKMRVAVVYGGRSAEHEISLLSAENIINALSKDKYIILPIKIPHDGKWFQNHATLFSADVVFPVLHGPNGEDGTIQGFIKSTHIPFVGSGILGSAVGMDKDVMKRLLKQSGLAVAKSLVFTHHNRDKISAEKIVKKLGLPLFVKPANLGSSIGVTKVKEISELFSAIDLAFLYDRKIILEEEVIGREIKCSILGNDVLTASLLGEVICPNGFYSYSAKYLDSTAAILQIPADIDGKKSKYIQNLAIKTAKVLCIEGMGRVDFFLRKDGKVYVNEINTIPGFTNISMYPKLWEASGISLSQLIDKLIILALDRHKKESKIQHFL